MSVLSSSLNDAVAVRFAADCLQCQVNAGQPSGTEGWSSGNESLTLNKGDSGEDRGASCRPIRLNVDDEVVVELPTPLRASSHSKLKPTRVAPPPMAILRRDLA